MSDTKPVSGGVPHAAGYMVTCDQVTIVGNGTTEDPLRAGSSSSGIEVSDDGVPVTGGPFTRLNFENATVADAGGGQATVAVASSGSAVLTWGAGDISPAFGFLQPGGSLSALLASDDASAPVPFAGTLSNLFIRHNSGSISGQSFSYVLFVNGNPTSLGVSGFGSTSPITVSDTTHTVSVEAGDLLGMSVNVTGAPGTSTVNAVVMVRLTASA